MSDNPEWSRRYAEARGLAGPTSAELARTARWEAEAAERRRWDRSFRGRLFAVRHRLLPALAQAVITPLVFLGLIVWWVVIPLLFPGIGSCVPNPIC